MQVKDVRAGPGFGNPLEGKKVETVGHVTGHVGSGLDPKFQ